MHLLCICILLILLIINTHSYGCNPTARRPRPRPRTTHATRYWALINLILIRSRQTRALKKYCGVAWLLHILYYTLLLLWLIFGIGEEKNTRSKAVLYVRDQSITINQNPQRQRATRHTSPRKRSHTHTRWGKRVTQRERTTTHAQEATPFYYRCYKMYMYKCIIIAIVIPAVHMYTPRAARQRPDVTLLLCCVLCSTMHYYTL